jgi:hypothetical protein
MQSFYFTDRTHQAAADSFRRVFVVTAFFCCVKHCVCLLCNLSVCIDSHLPKQSLNKSCSEVEQHAGCSVFSPTENALLTHVVLVAT